MPFLAPRTGSLAWGLSSEFQQSSDDLHSRVRFLRWYLEGPELGDRPWRPSGEKVCANRGDPRGERLHWNVFFLLVNARTRPMRDGKLWNFFSTSLRFVASLFEPPIRVPACPQIYQARFGTAKKSGRRVFAWAMHAWCPRVFGSLLRCLFLAVFRRFPARSWGPGRTSDQYERLK